MLELSAGTDVFNERPHGRGHSSPVFGKITGLLSELLPMSGAQNPGMVRNRMRPDTLWVIEYQDRSVYSTDAGTRTGRRSGAESSVDRQKC